MARVLWMPSLKTFRYTLIENIHIIYTNQTWKKFCSLAAGCTAAPKWSLRRSQNPSPTKNALKIHHFKGSRNFRLQAALKLFPGLIPTLFLCDRHELIIINEVPINWIGYDVRTYIKYCGFFLEMN